MDDIQATVSHLREQGVAIVRDVLLGPDGNLQAWIRDFGYRVVTESPAG